MLKISDKTNLLEQTIPEGELNCNVPNLHRDVYPYTEVPKVPFCFEGSPLSTAMPKDIWITDTTFRDGQQAVELYSKEQIVKLFTMLSRLSGENGKIRQTEFFVYGKNNVEAIENCRALGLRFPEITTWIRADKEELKAVRELNVKETGILTSVSDYQIYKKLGITRKLAMEKYLGVVQDAISYGITPRCHLEDLTRADFDGFVLPFLERLQRISEDSGVAVKLRLCDTMGYGVPYPDAALPRSVARIATVIHKGCGFSSDRLEWHGHNDFYKVVSNASTAWLYGVGAVNCSLFGRGERTGNIPLEAMVFEYASLKGDNGGMRTEVITEIADYYREVIGYKVPENAPFVGANFNMTRAGIHADGLMKDEEIYNIFDTRKLLNKAPQVEIGPSSGAAGLAYWINRAYSLSGDKAVKKTDELVCTLKKWVDEQYAGGRQTMMTEHELETKIFFLSEGKLTR